MGGRGRAPATRTPQRVAGGARRPHRRAAADDLGVGDRRARPAPNVATAPPSRRRRVRLLRGRLDSTGGSPHVNAALAEESAEYLTAEISDSAAHVREATLTAAWLLGR